MANDTPGSDPSSGAEPRPDRAAETTFHPRPDTSPYARPDAGPGGTARYGVGGTPGAGPTGTGQFGAVPPGSSQPGSAQPGSSQPGQAQTGQAQPGQAQPGQAQSGGQGQSGSAQPGQAQPGSAQSGSAPSGFAQAGPTQPGQGQPGYGWSGASRAGAAPTSYSPFGSGQSGAGQSGAGQPGVGQFGTGQFGSVQPGGNQSGAGQAGAGQSGAGQTGAYGPYAQGAGQGGQSYGAAGSFAGGPAQQQAPPRRRGLGALVAVGLVAALLGGGVGGAVGATLADGNDATTVDGSSGVLDDPLPEPNASDIPLSPVEAVAERVLPSVVRLLVEGPDTAGEGSGMVLSPDGLILTNNHVVESATAGGSILAVFQDGTTAPAQVVGLDPGSDLAVIRAQGVSGLTPIEFGDSDAVRVGQQVVAFGSPLGLGGTVTTGIVSAVDRAVSVGEESGASEATVLSALQTDAAINPGNSGGPLTDIQGRVVGINSVIATTGAEGGSIGVGFAIPVNQARRTAQELEATGRATRAILGAGVNAGTGQELTGAVLNSIVPGGPADLAGIRPGQVVTRVGDRVVTGGNDLIAAVRENAPGDQVTLLVDGQPVQVTLGSEPG